MNKCMSGYSKNEMPLHRVNIKSFYMATTEVTQLQWYKVMGNVPSHFKKEKLGYDPRNNPMENVSWDDAKAFIKKLNQMEGTDKYRLPTEAEWEYAARAGTTTKWSFGNSERELKNYAWYDKNAYDVGKRKYKIIRGGGWNNNPYYTRSALRYSVSRDNRSDYIGFRLTRTK